MNMEDTFAALSVACESRMAQLDCEVSSVAPGFTLEWLSRMYQRKHILEDLAAVFTLAGDQLLEDGKVVQEPEEA